LILTEADLALALGHDLERELLSDRIPDWAERVVARNVLQNGSLTVRKIDNCDPAFGAGTILRVGFSVKGNVRSVRGDFRKGARCNFSGVAAIEIGDKNIFAVFVSDLPRCCTAQRGNRDAEKDGESDSPHVCGAFTDGNRPLLISRFRFLPSIDIR